MSEKALDISVVIPTYNEMNRKELMQEHLNSIRDYFKETAQTYEIIIVLDGPTDGTSNFIENFRKENKQVQIINRKCNKGKGFSLREGMLQAKGNIVLFTDMDGATPIYMLASFLKEFKNGAALVIGSRKMNPKEYIKTHQPKWKEQVGELGNVFIQSLLGLKGIEDTQCGFKAFTKEATQSIIPKTTLNRWGIDFEMLVIAKQLNLKLAELPVEWKDSGTSLVGFSGYLNTWFELLSVKWKLWRGVYGI